MLKFFKTFRLRIENKTKTNSEKLKSGASLTEYSSQEASASSQPTIPKIFSFSAEKGGVGKTTICITLGYMFAERGKRVLIYDCESNHSSTSWIYGREIENLNGDLNAFVNEPRNDQPKTLFDQVSSNNLSAAYVRKINENLFLVPGNARTNELDAKIGFDEKRSEGDYGVNNSNEVTGKPYHAILKTAQENNIDYVLLDLSPYAGTLNRCLIMCSNYLIIPTIPDFFSAEMMRNMKVNLLKWNQEIDKYRVAASRGQYPLPEHKPKFLGYIMSRYMSNENGNIVNGLARDRLRHNEERWVNEVNTLAHVLRNYLNINDLAFADQVYNNVDRTFLLGNVREYHSLKNISDSLHVPVPFLTREKLREHNTRFNMREQLQQLQTADIQRIQYFHQIFSNIVQNIELIISG